MIKFHKLPFIKAENFSDIEVVSATAAQRAWAQLMVTQMLCCLCSEQQWVCWCGSNSSGNFGCQRTVNSIQLQLPFDALQYWWMLYSWCWLWYSMLGVGWVCWFDIALCVTICTVEYYHDIVLIICSISVH